MNDHTGKWYGRITLGICIAIVAALALIAVMAPWGVDCLTDDIGRAETCSKTVRNIGLSVAGGFGAIIAVIALYFNWLRTQTDRNRLDADRMRLVNDTYVKAIEQLGNKEMQVRLGAIFALERIAEAEEHYHWQIMQTLCGYLCEKPTKKWSDHLDAFTYVLPSTDIITILLILNRRSEQWRQKERASQRELPLRYLDWRGANFQRDRLRLSGADLQGANFEHSDLRGADFQSTHLWGARLHGARLQRATLRNANLNHADFTETNLTEADLRDAHLKGTILDHADLNRARFSRHPSKLGAVWDKNKPPKNLDTIILDAT